MTSSSKDFLALFEKHKDFGQNFIKKHREEFRKEYGNDIAQAALCEAMVCYLLTQCKLMAEQNGELRKRVEALEEHLTAP